jgi:hypothetical protein
MKYYLLSTPGNNMGNSSNFSIISEDELKNHRHILDGDSEMFYTLYEKVDKKELIEKLYGH